MKTIIVPTDYSETSRNALEYAAELATATQAGLLLYHAFPVPVAFSEVPVPLAPVDDLTRDNLALLEALATEIRASYPVAVECHTSGRPIRQELAALVRDTHAMLVVMGRRPVYGWGQSMSGSTLADVIRQATYPVLVVPDEAPFVKPAHIVFACDYTTLTAHTPLAVLKELAQTFGASVQVLHVEKPVTDSEGPAVATPAARNVNLEVMLPGIRHHYAYLENEQLLEGISQSLAAYQADWLVMVPRKHGFLDVLLNRSNTRKMAFRTDIPLLVLPADQNSPSDLST
jgi:nucleotide-binding universal stress UspA family protein